MKYAHPKTWFFILSKSSRFKLSPVLTLRLFCIRQNPSLLDLAQFTPLFVDLVTSTIHNPDFLFSSCHDFLLPQFDTWLSSSAS